MIKALAAFVGAALSVVLLPKLASAQQDWPAHPVQIIVPFAAGGTGDLLARMAAKYLAMAFKQQFVVQNRPGGGGIVGTKMLLAAPPDGYTIGESGVSPLSLVPVINANATYDSDKDFTHIAYLGGSPVVLAANPRTGVKTLSDFVSYANAPGKSFAFSSPGLGTDGHLWGVLIAHSTKVKLEHIPYSSTAHALLDVVAGRVPFCTFTLSSTLPFLQAHSLTGIAVTSPGRLQQFPGVPTFKELGKADLVGATWFSVDGPSGIPRFISEKINHVLRVAMAAPEVQQLFRRDGILAQPMNLREFAAFVAAENIKWKTVIQSAGLVGAVH